MTETKNSTLNKRIIKRIVRLFILLDLVIAMITAIYLRTNPKWRPSELTIEPAGRFYDIQCINPDGMALETRILPPEGYTRTKAINGSFIEFLRKYALLPDNTKLPVYDGTTMNSTDIAAIFNISLGDDGYQQCADSVIRLYSDYYYETKQYDKISFEFSNGDVCDYERWRNGKRMFVISNFSCEIPAAFPDNSEQQYRNYLKQVMRYSGTLSLQKESEVIPYEELQTGDIICNDVHVVLIVDEAVNDKGEKCFLIGQSFIPAVCFHILTHTEGKETSPWFTQDMLANDQFAIGAFNFKKEDIRRWKQGF